MKIIYNFVHFEKFVAFVLERHRIFLRRAQGKSQPWTKDPILARYRFTNVYRELDRVTVWIKEHWREPYQNEPNLWFAMVIARLVNHPETLAELSLPGRWNKLQFLDVMLRRKREHQKVFGSAYIVSTGGRPIDKAKYLATYVLDPMWDNRKSIQPAEGERLQDFYGNLMGCLGMGSFMAAQIVADMKYVLPLINAPDWWTFAASGPGSRRGMNYVMGHDVRSPWREHEWREALSELLVLIRPHIAKAKMPPLHAQDLQNCLCEYSKYRKTQLGAGRPKQTFTPNLEPLTHVAAKR